MQKQKSFVLDLLLCVFVSVWVELVGREPGERRECVQLCIRVCVCACDVIEKEGGWLKGRKDG